MPIKLANNATAHLAAPLLVGDTTLVLVSGEMGGFPSLAAGEYHPLTLVSTSSAREIVKVTARSGNILTIERGTDGTTALAFDAGALAEIRMTAGTITQLQADTAQARTDMLAAMDTKDATLSTTLQGIMDTKDSALHTTISAETAAAIAAIPAPAGAPVGAMLPWSLPTEPSGWIFADGRILTGVTPYTALRTAYINASFPHGQDGSGNPKIPDMRGLTAAGVDNMGTGAAGRLTGATLGALLGTETVTLTSAQIPAHTHTASTTAAGAHDHGAATASGGGHTHTGNTDTAPNHTHTGGATAGQPGTIEGSGGAASGGTTTGAAGAHSHVLTIAAAAAHTHAITAATDHTHAVTVNASTGGDGAHSNVQPTRALFWLVKT